MNLRLFILSIIPFLGTHFNEKANNVNCAQISGGDTVKCLVYNIDSIHNYYVIKGRNGNNIFEIISKKDPKAGERNIKIGNEYEFYISSIFSVNGTRIIPANAICELSGWTIDSTTTIPFQGDSIRDLFFAGNIRGLHYDKENVYASGICQMDSMKYKKLLDVAVFRHGFIYKRTLPLDTFIFICKDAFANIDRDTNDESESHLTNEEMTIYRTLANNGSFIDTTDWKTSELDGCVLVKYGAKIENRYALSVLKASNKYERKYYTNQIKSFNHLGPDWGGVFSFSRPLFDPTGNYAVIAGKGRRWPYCCRFLKWNGMVWTQMIEVSYRD